MKVTLRTKKLVKGRTRLYLDYYPSLVNPITGEKRRYENLKLFVFDKPASLLERKHNEQTEQLAENVRATRQLDLQCQIHGFTPDYKRLQSFPKYFRKLANRQRGMSRHNWDSSVRYFDKFVDGPLRFIDLDLSLCEDFKCYLLSSPKLRELRAGIGHNTALSYYSKFRATLRQAWREKLLVDDLYNLTSGLKEKEAMIEFLTINDIALLMATPVRCELCGRVTIFSLLTGLRFCDIQALTWDEIRGTKDNYYLQFRQKKTAKVQLLPISNQAYEILGKRDNLIQKVFPGIYYNQIRDFLVQWPADAGIEKHFTFSCLRHSYATLQLNLGTDIYTISKMLGHRHLKTTQRYTRVLDKKKQEAAKRLVFEF